MRKQKLEEIVLPLENNYMKSEKCTEIERKTVREGERKCAQVMKLFRSNWNSCCQVSYHFGIQYFVAYFICKNF